MPETATGKNWTRVAFGDVVRLSKERSRDPDAEGFARYVGLEHLEPGDLKIRSWGDVADGTTFTSVFRPGQVLFGKRRAYQRKLAVAEFSGVCSGDIYVFEPANDQLMPELLPFVCQTDAFFEHAIGTSAGSLSPRTNWKSLATYEFALPPLEEQRRIAGVLGLSNTLHNALHSALVKAQAALRSDLVTVLDHGPRPLREEPILPFLWEYVSLSDLIEVRHGYAFDGKYFTDQPTDDPLLLTPGNFSATGDLRFPPEKKRRFRGEVPNGYWLASGDLVVLMTDLTPTAALLGMPGMVSDDHGRLLQNQRIGLVKNLAPTRVSDRFLFYSFLGDQLRRLIRALSAGSTVSHTSPTQIRSLRIPLPPPHQQETLIERWDRLAAGAGGIRSRLTEGTALASRLRDGLIGTQL